MFNISVHIAVHSSVDIQILINVSLGDFCHKFWNLYPGVNAKGYIWLLHVIVPKTIQLATLNMYSQG